MFLHITVRSSSATGGDHVLPPSFSGMRPRWNPSQRSEAAKRRFKKNNRTVRNLWILRLALMCHREAFTNASRLSTHNDWPGWVGFTHLDLSLEFKCFIGKLVDLCFKKKKKINDANASQMLHFAELLMWKQTVAYSCVFLLCSSTLSVFCHCAFSYQPVEFSSRSLPPLHSPWIPHSHHIQRASPFDMTIKTSASRQDSLNVIFL